ncbi:MAG: hypothetical protein VXV86_04700, partial [Verrucomicrobiota bacterium]|nr:hypothetical protein [Verrucomicrobiota bacterium]
YEHRANLLWIPADSDYNTKQVKDIFWKARSHQRSSNFQDWLDNYFKYETIKELSRTLQICNLRLSPFSGVFVNPPKVKIVAQ